jgi:hypothetical protein
MHPGLKKVDTISEKARQQNDNRLGDYSIEIALSSTLDVRTKFYIVLFQ